MPKKIFINENNNPPQFLIEKYLPYKMQENRLGDPNYGGKHKYAPRKIFRERKYIICGNLGSHQSKVMSYLLMSIS